MFKIDLKKAIYISAATIFFASCSSDNKQSSAISSGWKSYSQDQKIEYKVDSVLALMTLEEKIGQMTQFSGHGTPTGPEIGDEFKQYLEKGWVGSMFNVWGASGLRKMQDQALEHSRLKIPLLFAGDVIHGYRTTFPIPLAEACSWDLELMEKSARIAAKEATSAGISWTFAPMVDISRDARWGRVIEGAGEDPYLGSLVAKARVKGFQGIEDYTDFADEFTMIACAKHFAAYGAAEAGRDYHTVDVSDRTLREIYFPPFQAAIDAGVATFMTAFNEISGVPCTGSKYLYTDVLRDEWDFRGMVVTDYTAINEMIDHGYAKDLKEAAYKTLDAGIDMDMTGAAYVQHVKQLYEEGKITVRQINQATARILELKFMLGLFDDPYKYIDENREKKWVGHPEHMKEARLNAQKSLVLLKNDKDLLPLDENKKQSIALIGPMVKERESLNGEWAIQGDRNESVTFFEGMTERYKNTKVTFNYAKGCDLLGENGKNGFKEAIDAARKSDVIYAAMGEDFNWSGEAASRTNITLPEPQRELLKELKKLNKPIVLVLFNGRPLDLSWEDEHVDAILEAWYPGTMAGHAVADVISGDYNPSAKLTMSFPRNVGQCPIYYNTKNTGRPWDENDPQDYRSSFIDTNIWPLYPFGHGLSYTHFEYNNLEISSESIKKEEQLIASIDITNSGEFDGEEIVQLYIQDISASVTRPIRELKGFEKITLKRGETKNVKFTIGENDLKMLSLKNEWIAEPGMFKIWIGKDSRDNKNSAMFELLQ
ncbi:beta-glucosidase BglX [Aureibacter tunicatorum]|uniref:beta-glucosidase n=1 Tax=Aureibacter tunicatorum TaxID=866807 RepID=A0AAE3XRI7_9BACT|nr:beta-glucosidase BglX [Aureibacter tunicatorum]MDR6241428.1 beta-glucosidase [Aureibacter tunicatorum]BDD06727.1 glycosyl hydrolase [Aureibacter tunicatorum]